METFYEVMRRQGISRRSFQILLAYRDVARVRGLIHFADCACFGDQAAYARPVAAWVGVHLLL